MIFRYLLIMVLLIASQTLHAQETSLAETGSADTVVRQNFLITGFGTGFYQGKDLGMSPLTYRGPVSIGAVGLQFNRSRELHHINIAGGYGVLLPRGAVSNAMLTHIFFSYHYFRLMNNPSETIHWYLGPTVTSLTNLKMHLQYSNSAINYDHSTSLGVAAAANKQLHFFRRNWQLSYHITLPVLNVIMRPPFVSSIPEGFFNDDISEFKALWQSLDIATVNNYFAIYSKINLSYLLTNGNALNISYGWDFYHFSNIPQNRVNAGTHTLALSTMFNF